MHSRGQVTHIRLSAAAQVAGVLIAGAVLAWVVNVSYAYLAYDHVVSAKDAALEARIQANYALRRELDKTRSKFAQVTDELARNHKGLESAIGQNKMLQGSLDKLRAELKKMADERDLAQRSRLKLTEQMAAMESRVHRAQTRNEKLSAELEQTGSRLASALDDSSKAARHETELSDRVKKLYGRLSDLRESQASLIGRIADASQDEIARLKKVLASTGLNVDRMMRQAGIANKLAQGGPFEPLSDSKATPHEKALDVAMVSANGLLDRLEGLQRVIRRLPLAAPLDYYYVSSHFGPRKDPINGRIAMHEGLDMGAKYRAPVYATAPGKVVFAGWNGGYGRFVEIDHGNGIMTRYGHLRRIYVKRGQKVDYRTKIGQMGNSGRSTGMHLHYEIQVRGNSVDPLKFLRAGKNVFKG